MVPIHVRERAGAGRKDAFEFLDHALVISVIFSGVAGTTQANASRNVTVGANGTVSWIETIGWPADIYATNISWRVGTGQPTNTTSGTLTVN